MKKCDVVVVYVPPQSHVLKPKKELICQCNGERRESKELHGWQMPWNDELKTPQDDKHIF